MDTTDPTAPATTETAEMPATENLIAEFRRA